MTALLAGLGVGALIGLPVSALTTRALCRGKRLRFPYGIPRTEVK